MGNGCAERILKLDGFVLPAVINASLKTMDLTFVADARSFAV